MEAEIWILNLVRYPRYETRQQYLFSTLVQFFLTKYYFPLKILVPKYLQKKYGGLMEAEIYILNLVRFPRYETRQQYLFSTLVQFFSY